MDFFSVTRDNRSKAVAQKSFCLGKKDNRRLLQRHNYNKWTTTYKYGKFVWIFKRNQQVFGLLMSKYSISQDCECWKSACDFFCQLQSLDSEQPESCKHKNHPKIMTYFCVNHCADKNISYFCV